MRMWYEPTGRVQGPGHQAWPGREKHLKEACEDSMNQKWELQKIKGPNTDPKLDPKLDRS